MLTKIQMPEIAENGELHITTAKHQGKGARTFAQFGIVSKSDTFTSFTFEAFSDFCKVVNTLPASRVTAKIIAACHAQAMENIDKIKADVVEFYENAAYFRDGE